MDAPSLGLSAGLLGEVFPFHLGFGRSMRVAQAGGALRRACPELARGALLDGSVRIVQPESVPLEFEAIRAAGAVPFVLELRARALRLRGRMVHDPESDAILFLGAPDHPSTEELRALAPEAGAGDDERGQLRALEAAIAEAYTLVDHRTRELAVANRRLRAHDAANRALAEADDVDGATAEILVALGEILEADVAVRFRPGDGGEARIDAAWSRDGRTLPDDERAAIARALDGSSLFAGVLATGTPSSLPHLAAPESRDALAFAWRARGAVDGGMAFLFAGEPPAARWEEALAAIATKIGRFVEHRLAEEALREREQRLREIAECIREVVWLVSPAGIEYVSPAFEEVFGRPLDELLADPMGTFRRVLHPDDRDCFAPEELLTREIEYRIVRPDGAVRWVRSRAFPVESGDGGRIAGIVEDITAHKESERVLREREERFRQIAEHIREVFWLASAKTGEMLWVSPAWEEITGRSLLDVFRRSDAWLDAVHPDDRERVRGGTSGLAGAFETEYRVLRPDGSVRWVHSRAFPVRDDRGEVYRVAGLTEDITSRKEAEQALRRSESELRELIEKMPDCVAVFRDDVFVYLNPAWISSLGYAGADEIIGRSALEFVHPDDREMVVERIRVAATGRPPGAREVRYVRKNGETVLYESMPINVIQFEGAPAVLVVARDVTEHRKIQAQLFLADRMASVGTLAAGVAHEINNPLAYLMANLRFIQENLEALGDTVPTQIRKDTDEALRDATVGAAGVRVSVRHLQTCARGDAEPRGPVEIRRVLECCINMAWNEIRHRARLVKDYGDTPPVDGNEARLGQLFLNLLVNAAQAIPEGNVERAEIRVATRTDAEGRVVVEVRDTGHGIPREHLARLFDPFFTTKPVGVGTGLGLSICHNIVVAHGGAIEVESEVGKGSVFRVVLRPSELYAARPSRPAPALPAPGRRGRILVIDDEPMIVSSVERLLGGEHHVRTAMSAREALDLLQAGERFDLILCDVMMPEMSGMDLHEELSRTLPEQAERMIFATGGAFTPRARAFLDRVTHQRIEKPFDPQNLRALVRAVLGRLPAQPEAPNLRAVK